MVCLYTEQWVWWLYCVYCRAGLGRIVPCLPPPIHPTAGAARKRLRRAKASVLFAMLLASGKALPIMPTLGETTLEEASFVARRRLATASVG